MTFWLPDQAQRQSLQPGDLAKLIFRISVESDDEPEAVERMWVLVRERIGNRYLGVLDNNPSSISQNGEFWSGIELPFEARHVIDITRADRKTRAAATKSPTRAWPR